MMSSKARARLRQMKANPIDAGRSGHTNMNITPVRKTFIVDFSKLKDPGEKPSEELEIDQDYSVIKKRVKTFASGKIEIKYVKNNPPGKRYFPRSESKIAKGDSIGDYGSVTGTTFADYQSRIKARKKEAEEASWRKK